MKKYYHFLIASALFLMLPLPSLAASLNIAPSKTSIGKNQQVSFTIKLNTDGALINAVEGTLSFSHSNMMITSVQRGGSMVNFWVEDPSAKISQANANGSLRFSGIVPGGFSGSGQLMTIVFQAIAPGKPQVSISQAQMLLNDGEGTAIALNSPGAGITITNVVIQENPEITKTPSATEKTTDEVTTALNDNDLPEEFTPFVTRDENVFDNQYFLIFNTQDKGSGISHYKVQEGSGEFKRAESPYVLENQSLTAPITVIAVDNTGNERSETIMTTRASLTTKIILFGTIGILLVVVSLLLVVVVKQKKQKQNKNVKKTKTNS